MTAASQRSRAQGRENQSTGPWWREMILYENHLPSFRDGNGDGIGDLEGLIQGLDYLAGTLGVTAVWVGPFYRSPLLDQGFDITEYVDVEPVFGDLATVERLVAEAHARGLRLIFDYVPNHTSDQHPWFIESRSSRDSPRRDWYVWADAPQGRDHPNNWLSEVTGSTWEWDERTRQFYLHSHLKEQPDLNWRNPEVRAAMLEVLRFWLDRGADGFRIDVAHMLMKDPELRDNPPNPNPLLNPYELQPLHFFTQLHTHDRMHPDLHGVLRDIRTVLDQYDGDRVAIGEVEAMDWDAWASFFGEQLDELQLPFAFRLIETPWRAGALRAALDGMYGALPDGAWPIIAFGNQDRSRLATRLGLAQARVAAVLLLTLRGVPTIFYGDELGMTDHDVPQERQRDHFAFAGGVSHDRARTPMPWNTRRNGGFSSAPPERLWLPVRDDYEAVSVEAQLRHSGSLLNCYRRLLALRKASAALRLGMWTAHDASDERCLVYTRTLGQERKLVALNLTGEPCELQISEWGAVVLSTLQERRGERVAGCLKLAPDEGLVVGVRHR